MKAVEHAVNMSSTRPQLRGYQREWWHLMSTKTQTGIRNTLSYATWNMIAFPCHKRDIHNHHFLLTPEMMAKSRKSSCEGVAHKSRSY